MYSFELRLTNACQLTSVMCAYLREVRMENQLKTRSQNDDQVTVTEMKQKGKGKVWALSAESGRERVNRSCQEFNVKTHHNSVLVEIFPRVQC